MARRLVRAANELAGAAGNNWKLVFVETTSLLFPMIELVGHARSDWGQVRTAYGRDDVLVANIWSGLHWLRDPEWLPQVTDNRLKYNRRRFNGIEIGHLTFLRNYFLHGSKNAKDRNGNPIPIADIMSHKLPKAIAERAEKAMRDYWGQLKQDDGTRGWVERLARADIQPLKIEGSRDFESGLIDPDIVDYLTGHIDIFGKQVSRI